MVTPRRDRRGPGARRGGADRRVPGGARARRRLAAASAFEVIVVLDALHRRDRRGRRAAAARLWPGRARCSRGRAPARAPRAAPGMDAAAARLLAGWDAGRADRLHRRRHAPRTGLARAPARARRAPGPQAIGGLIELDAARSVARLPGAVCRRGARRDGGAAARAVRAREPQAEHHHFAGASLAVTADVYARGRRARAAAPRSRTRRSPRACGARRPDRAARGRARAHLARAASGRARRGLAVDLASPTWSERRRYDAARLRPRDAARATKGATTVSVILPAKEVAGTIAARPRRDGRAARAAPASSTRSSSIDAGSADGTAAARRRDGRARARSRTSCCPSTARRSARATRCGARCTPPTATSSASSTPTPRIPIRRPPARPARPAARRPDRGARQGRVRAAVSHRRRRAGPRGRARDRADGAPAAQPPRARGSPGFAQPLAGEFAGRRELLEQHPVPGRLRRRDRDADRRVAPAGLDALAEMPARRAPEPPPAAARARRDGLRGPRRGRAARRRPRSPAGGHYLRPWEDGAIAHVPIQERPALRPPIGIV